MQTCTLGKNSPNVSALSSGLMGMSDFYSLAIAEMVEAAGYVCHIGFSEAGTEAQRVHPIGWLQIEYSLDRYDAGQMPALDSERKT